jgi:hypothetical protein
MRRTLTTGVLFGVLGLAAAAAAGAQTVADEHREAGKAAYLKLHFREAEGHFRAAADADPGSADTLYYLAYTVYKIAEPRRPNDPGKRRAAELFASAYQIDPGFTPDWSVPGRR